MLKIEIEMQKLNSAKVKPNEPSQQKFDFKESLLSALNDMFDGCFIENRTETNEIAIKMDKKLVTVDLNNSTVNCNDDKQLEQIVTNVFNQIKNLAN